MKFLRRNLFALAALLCFAAPSFAQTQPARVFAASSLTDALNEMGDRYAALGHPRPVFNFAASNTLARQIEQGADANLFLSADEDWMDYLATRHLLAPLTRVGLLTNRLVLIAPADHPLHLHIGRGFALHAALNGGRLAMADPDSAPAGRYGRAALQHFGVWASVEADIVRAENVRAALHFVDSGEAAAGIVYATDAQAAGARVSIIDTFPANSHPPISYPMAGIAGQNSAEGRAFAHFLQSSTARALFRRYGFGVR